MGHDRPVPALEVRVDDDPARRAAQEIVARLAEAVERRGRAALAVSGGSTGPTLLAVLAAADLPWVDIGIWQVDERVAPEHDPERNANQLVGVPGEHHLMPVTAPDLARAAAAYADELPDRFDVVHLGMGADGHTASWPPGDPVIASTRAVDLSGEYQGRVRMTLTPLVVDEARARVVLVTGADKAPTVAAWLEGGAADLPITRVPARGTVVVLDPAAAAGLRTRPPTGASTSAGGA
jgi:6-phosphogluconolactonase/glucosamine-6-phosphate isomerase/deaminase